MKRDLILSALKGYENQLDNELISNSPNSKNIAFLKEQINEAKICLATMSII